MSIRAQRIWGGFYGALFLALAIFAQPGWGFWGWVGMMLWPDLSALGYVLGPRVGAVVYNLFHHPVWGMALVVLGFLGPDPFTVAVGAAWVAHIGIDWAFGYGRKLPTGFRDTSLGRIGR